MNASVTHLSDFLRRPLGPVSDVGEVQAQVRARLTGRCSALRIAQAEARAGRLVAARVAPHTAIRQVVAWALYAHDPNPEPPLAA